MAFDEVIKWPFPKLGGMSIWKGLLESMLKDIHFLYSLEFLSLGLFVMFGFIAFLALGKNYYVIWQCFANSLIGEVLFMGWIISLFFHMLNGIRHLFWDYGIGLSLNVSKWTGIIVCILTFVLSILIGFNFLGLLI